MNKLKFPSIGTWVIYWLIASTLILWTTVCSGQAFTKRLQIHFATGKYVLTKEHKKEIRNLLDSIPKDDSDFEVDYSRIVVNGNTDNEGDSLYNLNLSAKRADAVIHFMQERGVDQGLLKKNYYGEAKPIAPNKNEVTKLKNRRVDIAVTYIIKKRHMTNAEIAASDPCSHDTLITLASGTRVNMSICDYERMGGEFKINEVLSGESVRQSGLNTMGDDGTPLMSGGMFNFKFKNDSCLKKPVVIRVPVDTCIKQPKKMMKYVYNYKNNRWKKTRAHIKVVKVDGKLYYEFSVQCPGLMNIDFPRYFSKGDVRDFYTKDGLKLVKLKISSDCPCSMLEASIKSAGKKASGWVAEKQPEPYISAIAVDKNGDTLHMQYKPISSLQGKGNKSVVGHFLWIFPKRSKIYYDKYCIKRSDFDAPATAKK